MDLALTALTYLLIAALALGVLAVLLSPVYFFVLARDASQAPARKAELAQIDALLAEASPSRS